MPHEIGSGEAKCFLLRFVVLGEDGIFGDSVGDRLEQLLSPNGPGVIDAFRSGKSGGAALGIDEINKTGFGSEKSGAATDIGISDEHVSGHVGSGGTAFVGDDGTDGRIGHAAADHATGVDEVGAESVFVDDVMIDRSDDGHALSEFGAAVKVFAKFHAGHGGLDAGVVGAGHFGRSFGVSATFRIEGVDLRHPASQPDEDAVFGFAFDGRCRRWLVGEKWGGASRDGCGRRGETGLEKIASVHFLS